MFKTFNIRTFLLPFFTISALISVLVFSSGAKKGVISGLHLCAVAVIPSLFLFTAIMLFCFSVDTTVILGKLLNPVARFVFNLSGEQLTVFIMSLFAGYPVGAKLISELYKSNRTDIHTARRMLNFCINAGPSFILIAVGEVMLGSKSDGIRLLIAHLSASMITAVISGVISRFTSKNTDIQTKITNAENGSKNIAEIFVESVTSAAETMLKMSGFIVLFAGIGGMISNLSLPNTIKTAAQSVLEVTVGISKMERGQLKEIAFLLGFSGISVIFQVSASAKELKPSLLKLFLGRIWHGTLSYLIIALAETFFPRSVDTVIFGQSPSGARLSGTPIVSLSLIFLCIVLICSFKIPKFSFKGRNSANNVLNL
jgi:sporulation integral membrane protein YlbJ